MSVIIIILLVCACFYFQHRINKLETETYILIKAIDMHKDEINKLKEEIEKLKLK